MKRKIQKLQILRFITQVAFFILLPDLFALTFGEIKQIYIMLIAGNFDIAGILPRSIEVLVVISITILLGRFFCGWFCAFGAYSDFIYMVSKKLIKTKIRVNEDIDYILKYLKYIVLIFIVVFMWTTGSKIFNSASPWAAFAQITELPGAISEFAAGFLILTLITIGAVFVERFFCRYLCPLGAIFSIVSRLRIFKIMKPTAKCGKCRLCTNNCPMGLALYGMEKVDSGECINCLKCTGVCPRKNPHPAILNQNIDPQLAGSIAIAGFVGVYSLSSTWAAAKNSIILPQTSSGADTNIAQNNGGPSDNNAPDNNTDSNNTADNNTFNNSAPENKSNASNNDYASGNIGSIQNGKYKDGTYTGTGMGHRPGIQVSVTIKGGRISNVEILSNRETPRYSNYVFSILPQEIVQAQSTNVDTVSGATESSDGLIMAVQDALSQAA